VSSVPDAYIDVAGETYGGAYWTPAEYRLVLSAVDSHTWTVEVLTSSDAHVTSLTLHGQHATELVKVINAPKPEWEVPGLETITRWDLGDDVDNTVLVVSELDEISAWLTYFLGIETWDPADDTWEF